MRRQLLEASLRVCRLGQMACQPLHSVSTFFSFRLPWISLHVCYIDCVHPSFAACSLICAHAINTRGTATLLCLHCMVAHQGPAVAKEQLLHGEAKRRWNTEKKMSCQSGPEGSSPIGPLSAPPHCHSYYHGPCLPFPLRFSRFLSFYASIMGVFPFHHYRNVTLLRVRGGRERQGRHVKMCTRMCVCECHKFIVYN